MIESTFWQAEKVDSLEQGLWDDIFSHKYNNYDMYCYNVKNGRYVEDRRTIVFNKRRMKYESPHLLGGQSFGATEHD